MRGSTAARASSTTRQATRFYQLDGTLILWLDRTPSNVLHFTSFQVIELTIFFRCWLPGSRTPNLQEYAMKK